MKKYGLTKHQPNINPDFNPDYITHYSLLNTKNNNNIYNNIYGQNQGQKKVKKRLNDPDLDRKFEEFYKQYPRKVKKQEVRKWFEKNQPSNELFSSIMNSLEQFRASTDWQKDGGQFIPYPSTWLNQRRWEDEIVTIQKTREDKIKETLELLKGDIDNDGDGVF